MGVTRVWDITGKHNTSYDSGSTNVFTYHGTPRGTSGEHGAHSVAMGDDNTSTDFESKYEFTINGISWETRPRFINGNRFRTYTLTHWTTTGNNGRPRKIVYHQLFSVILNMDIHSHTTGYHGTPREITARNQQPREAGDNSEPRTNNVC